MTATPADAARLLAEYGHTDSDTPTTADLVAAAELAGLGHPDRAQQAAIRTALDHLVR
ncbi:hypothetical protein [Streptomyces sp. KL116D]|uniref:hypothetical protein n=1 Tax=Streptomyces sp. KL116D TaxID=3045152 RepID=UPI0035568291